MDAISAASSGHLGTTPFGVPRELNKVLDAQDFMKLLTVQLANQDPMNPMQDTEFVSQMSSFTSLEQMQDLVENFGDFSRQQEMSNAQGFLGNEVVYTGSGGTLQSGLVTAVRTKVDDSGNSKLLLSVGNDEISVDQVEEVRLPDSAA